MISKSSRNHLYFDEIDSTNTYLKEHYQELDSNTIIQTGYQTKGRGQFNRVWDANKGENLLFSILYKGELPFLKQEINPIIISALIGALDDYGIKARYKIPNDIYVEEHKIAGILIETKFEANQLAYMIVGIGLNVNQRAFKGYHATSMGNLINKRIDINDVLSRIVKYIQHNTNLLQLVKDERHEYETY